MSNPATPRFAVPKSGGERLINRPQSEANRFRDEISILEYAPSIKPPSNRSGSPAIPSTASSPSPAPILPPINRGTPANNLNIDFESRPNLRSNLSNNKATMYPEIAGEQDFYSQPDPVNPKKTIHVKKTAVLSQINDLVHLIGSRNENGAANVTFYRDGTFKDGVKEQFHSFVLLARSDWFRRSWRAQQSDAESTNYNFTKARDSEINKFDIGITVEPEVGIPAQIDGEFKFILDLPTTAQFDFNEFRKALKQFKKYLYTGDCDINESTAGYLVALAQALKVESLKEFISDYYKTKFAVSSFDMVLEQMEIAHNYKMTSLEDECIRIVNENALQIINSAKWQDVSRKYPALVLRTFKKNDPAAAVQNA